MLHKTKKRISSLKQILTKINCSVPDMRADCILNYYKQDPVFIDIRKEYKKGNYTACLNSLLEFICVNKKILFLETVFFNNNFVNNHINDYCYPNCAVIRNYSQLVSRAQQLESQKLSEEAQILISLSKKIIRVKRALLLSDDVSNKQRLFQAILHELNAWLSSGCTGRQQSLICLIEDWRRYIPKQDHRKLDNYIRQY